MNRSQRAKLQEIWMRLDGIKGDDDIINVFDIIIESIKDLITTLEKE